MKKLLFASLYLFLLFLISGCQTADKKRSLSETDKGEGKVKGEQTEEPKMEPKSEGEIMAQHFIEQINEDRVLMSEEEIQNYNQAVMNRSKFMYHLDSFHVLTKKEVQNYINSYSFPKLPQYNGTKKITSSTVQKILDNRNLNAIPDKVEVKKGIIVRHTNLRSFPTTVESRTSKDSIVDNLQESELLVNVPVLIIHESLDQEWYFVISLAYYGWVEKKDIVLVTDEEYQYFTEPNDFVIVTEATVNVEGVNLDMSVRLPLIREGKDDYIVALPTKNEEGIFKAKTVALPKTNSHLGYLPYTKENVYRQAFKYLGTKYIWGSKEGGIDCSSFVANVYRTFGFSFPRNTSHQKESLMRKTSLIGKTNSEKLWILQQDYPCLAYEDGHVVIYLGVLDGKHYIIHAVSDTMDVTVMNLEECYHLRRLDSVIVVE